MSSTFFGLNIASSGLNAFQASINTTANNISNVQTEGYSKQVVNKEASSALRAFEKYGNVGTGVSATSVTRLRDAYYDKKYWTNQSHLGYYTAKEYYMQQVEDYYTDDPQTNPGFSTVFAKVFNSLNAVKSSAGDASIRSQFVSDAQKLCTYFKSTAERLNELQVSINDEIKTTVDKVNAISQKLALLTKQINTIEMNGGYANELRDQRELLVDDLSEIISVSVDEGPVTNTNYPNMDTGATYYTVKVNGQILVDSFDYNELATQTRDEKYNQTDVDGLYEVVWAKTGNKFDVYGNNQYGTLRGLFEVRDGNDELNMRGSVGAVTSTTLTLERLTTTDINYLSMPSSGSIMINNTRYEYDGFTLNTDDDGNIKSVVFDMKNGLTQQQQQRINGCKAEVGETVDYKGIPYYQNQMNAFLRSFAKAFNDLQEQGMDHFGDDGQALFTANDAVLNEELNFDRNLYGSAALSYEDRWKNASLSSSDDTYYRLTAANVRVSSAVSADPRLLSATYKRTDADGNVLTDGQDSAKLVEDMLKLEKDVELFRGGGATSFLQCIYADITVDTQECSVFKTNYTEIQDAITKQRQSVFGVDEDDEALDLVKFQNAYNLNAKVIQVMTEIYDRLILNTGV